MDNNRKDLEQSMWSSDVKSLAKWSALFGLLLYVIWAANSYDQFDGIFNKKNLILGADFVNYWSAARLTNEHHILTLFDPKTYHEAQQALFGHDLAETYNWSYPPSFIPWILWLGFFSYPLALVLWLTGTFAFCALAVAYKRPLPWGLAALLIFAPSSCINFSTGQNGFLSAALLVGGLRLLSTRPILAGLLLGCLSYKPQLGFLVPIALIAARKWRVFIMAAFTTLALIVYSLILFGIEPWKEYLATVPAIQQVYLENISGPRLPAGDMMPSVFRAMRILGASLFAAYLVAALTALGAVIAVIYAYKHGRSSELQNAILLTATFLVSPYIFSYDMPLLTAGLIGTMAAQKTHIKNYYLAVFLVAWLLPAFVFSLNKMNIPLSPLIILALLVVQLGMIKAQEKEPANKTETLA